MIPEQKKTADKTTSVTAARDNDPAGPKQDAAQKHSQAAEKGSITKNDVEPASTSMPQPTPSDEPAE